MSDKKTKKTADDTRNSQNRRCDAYNYFCRAALEAKSARCCSQKLLFEGAWSEKESNRTSNAATRANKSGKNGRLGVRKVMLLMQSARNRFATPCFPLQREALC